MEVEYGPVLVHQSLAESEIHRILNNTPYKVRSESTRIIVLALVLAQLYPSVLLSVTVRLRCCVINCLVLFVRDPFSLMASICRDSATYVRVPPVVSDFYRGMSLRRSHSLASSVSLQPRA